MKAGVFDRKGRNDHIENFFKPYALLCLKFLRPAQIFRYMKHLGFGYSSRQGAKNAKFG